MKHLLHILIFTTLINTSAAQQYAWNQKTNFTAGLRAGATSFAIGNKAYYTCGINAGLTSQNDLWEYDAALNTWTQLANLTGPVRYSPSAFSINGFGYVCLGWQQVGGPVIALSDLWQYNPLTNSWLQKSDFTGTARYTAVAFVVGSKAYVGTGYAPLKNDFYEYDPSNDTWTLVANQYPGAVRQSSTAFAITYTIGPNTFEKGYVCTGALDNNGISCANDLWEFTPGITPGSGTWAAKPNFPGTARYAAFSFSLNGKGFVGGGMSNNGGTNYFTDMYAFDPVANSWMLSDSFPGTNRTNGQRTVIGNKAYVGTGTFSSGIFSDQMWEYAPTGTGPVISLQSSDTNFCEKNCIDFFDLSTNNPTSWQWFFPGADSTSSTLQNPANICYNNYGSFDVTLIACNANACDTLTFSNFINCFPNPVDSVYQSNDTLYSNQALSYQWFETSTGLIAGATNQYYVFTQPGSYYCVISDSIGCVATSNAIVITGLTDPPAPQRGVLSIVPNPNDGNFEVVFNSHFGGWGALRIYNAVSQIVFNSSLINHRSQLNTHLKSGIYFVEARIGETVYREKMVVK